MLLRVSLVVAVVLLLAALILASQFRNEPRHVSGFIEADEIRLGSRIGGRVARVLVQEGDRVQAGQPLLELEPFDLLERETQASRNLAASEAAYQRLLNGLRSEEVAQAKARFDQLQAKLDRLQAGPLDQEIQVARARLEAANDELLLAQQLYERDASLAQNNAVSQEELERTMQGVQSANAMQTVRKNELELLELGTREEDIRSAAAAAEEARQGWLLAEAGYRQEEIDQANATRDAAQAALDAIVRQRDELVIHSPLEGVVDSLDLQPGDMVAAGAPVISIVDHRHLWVRAYVPQNEVGLQVGQTLRVHVDSLPGQDFVGTISFIARQAEFTPSNVQTPKERAKQVFRIKVMLEEPGEQVRPGMTVDVWLDAFHPASESDT